jgi:hypothetical protein
VAYLAVSRSGVEVGDESDEWGPHGGERSYGT